MARDGASASHLFYFSTPPSVFPALASRLRETGLESESRGWSADRTAHLLGTCRMGRDPKDFLADFAPHAPKQSWDITGTRGLTEALHALFERNVDVISKSVLQPHWAEYIMNEAELYYVAKRTKNLTGHSSRSKIIYKALVGVKRRQFLEDPVLQSAVVWQIYVISDLCNQISHATKRQHPEIDWVGIKNARNSLAHEYRMMNWAEVWNIASKNVPELEKQINTILAGETT